MEDRISRWLQHCHKTYCEKGGHHRRQACIIWRWYHHRNVISGQVDLHMTLIHLSPLFSWQQIGLFFPWHKPFFHLHHMVLYLLHQHSLTCFLSKDMNLWGTNFLVSSSDFTDFFSLFQISYSSATLFTSIILSFFCFFYSLLSFSLFPLSFLLLSASATLASPASVSTAFHTLLNTLSSSPLLFSSQFQDCGK